MDYGPITKKIFQEEKTKKKTILQVKHMIFFTYNNISNPIMSPVQTRRSKSLNQFYYNQQPKSTNSQSVSFQDIKNTEIDLSENCQCFQQNHHFHLIDGKINMNNQICFSEDDDILH